jgi:hypothetical protein
MNPTDTQLLDWLDAQGSYFKWNCQTETDFPHIRDCIYVSRSSTSGMPDVRTAIIEAMKRLEEKTRNDQ